MTSNVRPNLRSARPSGGTSSVVAPLTSLVPKSTSLAARLLRAFDSLSAALDDSAYCASSRLISTLADERNSSSSWMPLPKSGRPTGNDDDDAAFLRGRGMGLYCARRKGGQGPLLKGETRTGS